MPEPHEEVAPVSALALVRDLLFASRIRGAADLAGVKAVVVANAEDLLERVRALRPRIILLDLDAGPDAPSLITRLKEDPATAALPLVAFAAHVNRDAIEAARAAGADRVLARSAFVRELPALLGGTDAPGP